MKCNVIPLAPDSHFITLRQDFIQLCQTCTYRKSDKSKSSAHCKALILAVMERWTNYKIEHAEGLHIHLTIPQWIDALYSMFSYNAIADSLEELAYEGLISREKFKTNTGGRDQYKYLLNYKAVNARLATLIFDASTVINQGCYSEEPSKVMVATIKNQGCSSSNDEEGTIKSQAVIYSVTTEQSTDNQSTYVPANNLSPLAEEIWNNWANRFPMPPRRTAQASIHCETLATMCEGKTDLTTELMEEVRKWAQKTQSYLRNKLLTDTERASDWKLGNIVTELPKYLLAVKIVTPPSLAEEENGKTVIWGNFPNGPYSEREAVKHWNEYRRMTISEARKYNYDPSCYPGEVLAKIDDMLYRLEEGEIDREGNPIQQLAYA